MFTWIKILDHAGHQILLLGLAQGVRVLSETLDVPSELVVGHIFGDLARGEGLSYLAQCAILS